MGVDGERGGREGKRQVGARKKKKKHAATAPCALSPVSVSYLGLPDQAVHDRIPRLARHRCCCGGGGGRAEGQENPVVGARAGGDGFLEKKRKTDRMSERGQWQGRGETRSRARARPRRRICMDGVPVGGAPRDSEGRARALERGKPKRAALRALAKKKKTRRRRRQLPPASPPSPLHSPGNWGTPPCAPGPASGRPCERYGRTWPRRTRRWWRRTTAPPGRPGRAPARPHHPRPPARSTPRTGRPGGWAWWRGERSAQARARTRVCVCVCQGRHSLAPRRPRAGLLPGFAGVVWRGEAAAA